MVSALLLHGRKISDTKHGYDWPRVSWSCPKHFSPHPGDHWPFGATQLIELWQGHSPGGVRARQFHTKTNTISPLPSFPFELSHTVLSYDQNFKVLTHLFWISLVKISHLFSSLPSLYVGDEKILTLPLCRSSGSFHLPPTVLGDTGCGSCICGLLCSICPLVGSLHLFPEACGRCHHVDQLESPWLMPCALPPHPIQSGDTVPNHSAPVSPSLPSDEFHQEAPWSSTQTVASSPLPSPRRAKAEPWHGHSTARDLSSYKRKWWEISQPLSW